MKLSAAYTFPFSVTQKIPLALWESCTKHDSFNGFYVLLDDVNNVDLTVISTALGNATRINTWYDLSGSTNYLYSYNTLYPTLVQDPLFNNKYVLDFPDAGTTQLRFKTTQTIGTIIFVYLNRTSNGHLILAPRTVPNTSPLVYYDMFPRTSNILWSTSSLSNDFARNSVSRINGKQVSPDYIVNVNTPRILTVKGFPTNTVDIQGIGGRQGGPSFAGQNVDSVEGKIAAIISFSENLSDSDVLDIELELQKLYISYIGPALSTTPSFKYLVGQSFSYDFSTVAVDEWFSIVDYELVSPLDLGLSFSGSTLSGVLSKYYEGNLSIRISNEAGLNNLFSIPLRALRQDPLVSAAPYQGSIQLALTSDTAIDNSTYGYYNTHWESGLRSQTKTLLSNGSLYPPLIDEGSYNSVRFYDSSTSLSINSQTAKSFLWVYIQESYGARPMLTAFPDIKGNGELWTVANNTQVHGTTDITSMTTYVNKQIVDTLSYKLELNKLYFISATSNTGISFSGVSSLRGRLLYFISWSNELTKTEIDAYIAELAPRYYNSLKPYQTTEDVTYSYVASNDLDLNTYIVDFYDNELIYSFDGIAPLNASITDNILTITNITDTLDIFNLIADNGLDTLAFSVTIDTILLANVLYRALKLQVLVFNQIFINEISTVASNNWTAYKGDCVLEGSTLSLENIYAKDYLLLPYVGNDTLTPTTALIGKVLTFYYIQDPFASGSLDIFEINNSEANFSNIGLNLLNNNTHILFRQAVLYVNGEQYTNYTIQRNVPYIITFKFTTTVSITSITNCKGYIGALLMHDDTNADIKAISKDIHQYYNPGKLVLSLSFNNNVTDTALQSNISHTSYFSTTKFEGTHSYYLLNNKTSSYLVVDNNTNYVFNRYGFKIRFYIAVNKAFSNSTDKLIICQFNNFVIYLNSTGLIIARSTVTTPLLTVTLTYSTSVFTKIEVINTDNVLSVYKDDALTLSAPDVYAYDDYLTSFAIGQPSTTSANLVTTSMSVLLDMFTVESL